MEKTDDTRKMGRKDEVFRSFSGWLSDIITARPSLLVFSLVPLPSLSISTLSPFLVSTCPFSPPVFRLTVLSLSVPTGLRGQHGEISDQFFKPRVPRLYTPWETTLGWAQSEISTLGSRGFVLRCRGSGWGWNQAAKKIKRRIRRILKGSRPGCSRTFITAMYPALTSSPISSPQHLNTSLSISLFLACRLFFLGQIDSVRKRHDCSSSYIFGYSLFSTLFFHARRLSRSRALIFSRLHSANAHCPCSFNFRNENRS